MPELARPRVSPRLSPPTVTSVASVNEMTMTRGGRMSTKTMLFCTALVKTGSLSSVR
jgi:hypothetical protein